MMQQISDLGFSFDAVTVHEPSHFDVCLDGSSALPAQLWKGSDFTIRRRIGAEAGTVVFECCGPFTARDMYSSLTPADLQGLFDSCKRERQALCIFDLTHVPYMDSAGLGVLVKYLLRLRSEGIELVLTGVNRRVLQLLKMTRTDSLLPIAATAEEVGLGHFAN